MRKFFASALLFTSTVAAFAAGGPDSGSDSVAPTGGPEGAPAGVGGGDMTGVILMFGFLAFMYFVLIRPQRKEQKKREAMVKALKVGDKVVTIGGLHGKVVRRGESDVDIEAAEGVILTFNAGAVHEVPQDTEDKK